MGGSVSSGRNNDELIDNLVDGGLIKSQMVESVFRAVDRGIFYLPKFKEAAYRDLAWREGHIHISAPCIYTRVMEALELEPNLSFLNIGSGTGYFSTMVGLILGENGINHNIELHKDIIDYGKQKINEFVKTSVHFDDFDFCIPKFVNGNILNLNVNSECLSYDRIYVGFGVTEEQEQLIKSLVKLNGIIVMPLNDNLIKLKRISETDFESASLMTVSFASLVTDNIENNPSFDLPQLKPLSLQEICRFQIRKKIRESIKRDYQDYYQIKREMSTYNKNRVQGHNCRNDSEDADDNNNDNRSSEVVCPLTRFERLFTPRRTEENRQETAERSNIYFENQLRMMIYGQLLNPSRATNMLEYIPSNDNDNEESEDEDNNNEDENEDQIGTDLSDNGDENNDKESNNVNVVHTNYSDKESVSDSKKVEEISPNSSTNSLLEDEIEENDVKKLISKEISIPISKTLDTKNSISESGFSENSNSVMSIELSTSNSSGNSSIRSVVEYKPGYDLLPSSSLNDDSKMSQLINDENENLVRTRHDSTSSSSSSSGDEENDGKESIANRFLERYKPKHKCRFEKRTQTPGCSKVPQESFIIRENHLRTRIMKLPLSTHLKNFLLYNRQI